MLIPPPGGWLTPSFSTSGMTSTSLPRRSLLHWWWWSSHCSPGKKKSRTPPPTLGTHIIPRHPKIRKVQGGTGISSTWVRKHEAGISGDFKNGFSADDWSRGERKENWNLRKFGLLSWLQSSRGTVISGPDWAAAFDVLRRVPCAVFLLLCAFALISTTETLGRRAVQLKAADGAPINTGLIINPFINLCISTPQHHMRCQSIFNHPTFLNHPFHTFHTYSTNFYSFHPYNQSVRYHASKLQTTDNTQWNQPSKHTSTHLESSRVIRRSHVNLVALKLPSE